jgi:hypothetical protein
VLGASYFPMPFLHNARIELQAGSLPLTAATCRLPGDPGPTTPAMRLTVCCDDAG